MKYKQVLRGCVLFIAISILHTTNSYSSDSIQLEPGIKYGKLENGLSYYIKPVENGSSKIHMSLIVKVGLNQEEKHQAEFAHVVEHLGLTAGKNVSLKKSSHLFDKLGFKLGNVNGHIQYNHTKYFINIDKSSDKAVNVALGFFHDIIWNLEMNEKNVAAERVSVINEGRGGDYDIGTLLNSLEKDLIGMGAAIPNDFENHLKKFKTEDLVQFYNSWYQPNLMALVIVGDIQNIDKIENKIKEKFGRQKLNPAALSKRITNFKYGDKKPQFFMRELRNIPKDMGRSPIGLRLYFRQEMRKEEEASQKLKAYLTREMFLNLLNNRLEEMRQNYNTFYFVRGEFLDPPVALKLNINTQGILKKEVVLQTYRSIFQIYMHGFSLHEFTQVKNDMLLSLAKNDTLETSYWEDEITQYYVDGEPLPANKNNLLMEILRGIKIEELNAISKDYIKGYPEDIMLAAYNGNSSLNYSKDEIRSWLKEAQSTNINPYSPPLTPNFLLHKDIVNNLKENSVIREYTEIPGAEKFKLENGVTFILKPFSPEDKKFHPEIIRFQGFSNYGLNCFSDQDYFSAINAPAILMNSGIGNLNMFELKRFLEEREFNWNVQPYINRNETGIRGATSLENLEIALQQVYLYFTSPNFNQVAFEDWKVSTKLNSVYENIPTEDLNAEIRKILPDDDFIPGGTNALQGIDKIEFKRVKEIYHKLYKDAGDFTFIISGDFKNEEVLLLFKKYLGNLPIQDKNKLECKNKVNVRSHHSHSKTFLTKEKLNEALVKLIYVKPMPVSEFNWREEIKVNILRHLMRELFIRNLRFESDFGGVYMVPISRELVKSHDYHEISIFLACIPAHSSRLIQESYQLVDSIRDFPVDELLFKRIKNDILNKKESVRDILNSMYEHEKFDKVWVDNKEKRKYISTLTSEDIRHTARKYLNGDPFEFKMLPIH